MKKITKKILLILVVILILLGIAIGLINFKLETIVNKSGNKKILAATQTFTAEDCPYPIFFDRIYSSGSCSIGIDTSGTIWAWGVQEWGQFGIGNTNTYQVPTVIHSGKSFKKIEFGIDYALYLDSNGYLWASGRNNYGQLGNGTNTNTTTLIPVASGTRFKDIAVDYGESASFAIDINGNIWGANNHTTRGPMASGLTATFTQLTTGKVFEQISTEGAGYALDKDGIVWAWGNNAQGELGDGGVSDSIPISRMVRVELDVRMAKVEKVFYGVRAIDTIGCLYMWGNFYNEQGTLLNKSTPIRVKSTVRFKNDYNGTANYYILDQNGNLWDTRNWTIEKTGVKKYFNGENGRPFYNI